MDRSIDSANEGKPVPDTGAIAYHTPDLFAGIVRPPIPKAHRNSLTREQREKLLTEIEAKPFNDRQLEMVEHVTGPFLGLAGAGSGKTHAATHRIARLVACGVRPGRILALTFTNKAAKEMKDRAHTLLREYTQGAPTVRTLHSLGFKILKEGSSHLNYKQGVRIISDIFAEKLLQRGVDTLDKQAQKDLGATPTKALAQVVSAWKNDGLDPASVIARGEPLGIAYKVYQQWLVQTGFVDFDDLLRLPVALFTKTAAGPELLAAWQRKFDFIIVDEYQDTNQAQEDLLTLLAQQHRNICVVGDDDQAIYGWRGANVEIIRTFPERWSGTRVAKLELNYRSTPEILEVANKLITSSEENRHDKTLRSTRDSGVAPSLHTFPDEWAEAKWIAKHIHEQLENGTRTAGDVAILVRDQYRAKVDRIEEALADLKIPYESWFNDDIAMGPLKRNAYSLLTVAHDPKGEEPAFMQLLESSRFQLLSDDYARLIELRENGKKSIWDVMNEKTLIGVSPEAVGALRELRALVSMLHTRARLKGRVEGLGNIARDGFKLLFPYAAGDALWNDPAVTNDDTLALRKIVRNIQSYEDSARVRHKTLASYLNFQLVEIPRRIREGDTKRKAHEGRTKVTLMTMHGAKGLEFPVVYLPAFVEGVIPHERTMKEARELEGNDAKKYEEEERRLAYVAVTRAMDRLHISFPMRMARRGGGQAQEPSRYLREMGLIRSMDTSGLKEA